MSKGDQHFLWHAKWLSDGHRTWLQAKNKAAFVSSGPTSNMSPPGRQSMGFSAFNSMSGGSQSLAVYFPFTSGVKPSAKTAIRTSLAQSPLYKLPSRMILSFNAVDEVLLPCQIHRDPTKQNPCQIKVPDECAAEMTCRYPIALPFRKSPEKYCTCPSTTIIAIPLPEQWPHGVSRQSTGGRQAGMAGRR